jgi:hypothetical protein
VPPRKPKPKNIQGPRVKWNESKAYAPPPGKEGKRFYQTQTLASATERQIKAAQSFILASMQTGLGTANLAAYLFEFACENEYSMTFRLKASTAKRKQMSFAYIVAKSAGIHSKLVEEEWGNLRALHARAARFAPKPLRMGTLYLPERYNRSASHREIAAYLTLWPAGDGRLTVGKTGQFALNTRPPKVLSKALTQAIQCQITAGILQSYDPKTQTGVNVATLRPADFVLGISAKGVPRVQLAACRTLLSKYRSDYLLHDLLHETWTSRSEICTVAPEDPTVFEETLRKAVGNVTADEWMQSYLRAVRNGKIKAPASGLHAFAEAE